MRSKFIKSLFFLIFLTTIGLVWPAKSVFAENINSFDDSIIIHQNGTFTVQENIQYNFGDLYKHGIIRDIPLDTTLGNNLYRDINIIVTSVQMDGQNEEYSLGNSSNNDLQIKIGNPNYTMNGVHTYVITYDVSNGIGNYTNDDELYWNVTGNSWTVPINQASAKISTDFGLASKNAVCYTGPEGSRQTDCTITTDSSNAKSFSTNSLLNPSEGLSVVVGFPPGTFPKSNITQITPVNYAQEGVVMEWLILGWLVINILGTIFAVIWYFKHKHKKRFGPITVNFDLPKTTSGLRITPCEAATIDQPQIDTNCLSATIFDLAVRKYLKIEETDEKGGILGIGAKTDYKLTKLKSFDDLNNFEKTLVSDMFESKSEIYLSDVNLTYLQFNDLQTTNYNMLVDKGLYNKALNPSKIPLIALGIMAIITLNVMVGSVLLFLSSKFNSRTDEGDLTSWKIDGLELFLKNMKPEYQWQAEKVYVVEQMIPYAIALGYIDHFMKQLQILNPQYQPTFYTGRNSFYMMYPAFHSSLSHGVSYAAPASSSGFSSGGFSGGGGGGGGGGSW